MGGIGAKEHSCVLGILRVGHSEHVVAVGECDTSETDLNLFMTTFFPSVTELLSMGLAAKIVIAASPWDFKDPCLLFLQPASERVCVLISVM